MKKMDIVVSQRDKKLLVVLVAVVIGFLCYNFIISPALDKGSVLKIEEEAANVELERVKTLTNNLSSIKTKESDKKQEMQDKYKQFFYDLNQEQILYKFDSLFHQSGLFVNYYELSELVVADIAPGSKTKYSSYPLLDLASKSNKALTDPIYKINSGDVKQQSAVDTADDVPTYDVTIRFSASKYSSVMAFIKGIEQMDKTILIKKLDIRQSAKYVSGEIILSLYALPKVDESESGYLEFLPSAETGKDDPFH